MRKTRPIITKKFDVYVNGKKKWFKNESKADSYIQAEIARDPKSEIYKNTEITISERIN